MRVKLGITIGVLMAAVVAFAPAPGAGARQAAPNTFTVVKEVVGPVPAGTVFEVQVECVPEINKAPDAEGVPLTTFQFDENGDPIGPNTLNAGFFVTCHAEETEDGGAASVAYACETSVVDVAPEGDSQVQCVDDQTVFFGDIAGANGTITVTNTFEPEPPPPPPDVEPDDVVPDVVNAAPSFTG